MNLNSHAMFRPNPLGADHPALVVPQEAPPLGRSGQEEWPPDWPVLDTRANTRTNTQDSTHGEEFACDKEGSKGGQVSGSHVKGKEAVVKLPKRTVDTEEDLHDLLGIPCWDPTDRNCPG